MNIEEDIKILKDKAKALNEHIKDYEESSCTASDVYRAIKEEKEAIENILAEYKRVKQENERLTKNNFKLNLEIENRRKEYQETYKDIREELKELKTKANKYDALVEKMEKVFKKRRLKVLQENKNPEQDIVLNTLQELLEKEE